MVQAIQNNTAINVQSTAVLAPIQPVTETQMIEVFCDLCDENMHGTRANLERYGWGIYTRFCFCPFHENEV